MKKMWFQSLDQEDPLEEGMATHSSILTWEIPWTEETDGLQSMGSQSLTQLKRPSRWTQFGGTWRNQRQNLWLLVKVKVTQSCLTLCNPMDYTVHGILWARILEWVAFPISRGSSQPRDWTQVSRIAGGFFTSWTIREALAYKWKVCKWSYNASGGLKYFAFMV